MVKGAESGVGSGFKSDRHWLGITMVSLERCFRRWLSYCYILRSKKMRTPGTGVPPGAGSIAMFRVSCSVVFLENITDEIGLEYCCLL